jgi:hypothetical protein
MFVVSSRDTRAAPYGLQASSNFLVDPGRVTRATRDMMLARILPRCCAACWA